MKNRSSSIFLLYSEVGLELAPPAWQASCLSLPRELAERINRFYRPRDRQARLISYLLLREIYRRIGERMDPLVGLLYDENGRPSVGQALDVNWSHTENYVVLAVAWDLRVGVDLEELGPVDLKVAEECLHPEELEKLRIAPDPSRMFLEIWTRKEAVAKADGRGLQIGLSRFSVLADTTHGLERVWHIKSFTLGFAQAGALAASADFDFELEYVPARCLLPHGLAFSAQRNEIKPNRELDKRF